MNKSKNSIFFLFLFYRFYSVLFSVTLNIGNIGNETRKTDSIKHKCIFGMRWVFFFISENQNTEKSRNEITEKLQNEI